ncbi:sensor histidine kinase [Rubripirellula reticaptiva]|uniref:sensor histidine kinase n=1 Tax=Rubripirellula reticaptiva TaxID=2528013 RepID=UPI0011B699F9|nr:PAS domain-containing sensor histidine kinase [Rubripirellula reticaptiva]
MNKQNSPRLFVGVAIATGIAIFAMDCWLPVGIAAPVAYIAGIYFAYLSRSYKAVLLSAVLFTVLSLVGWYVSLGEDTIWKAIENRCLSILAIWMTSFFCIRFLHELRVSQDLATELSNQREQLQRSEEQARSMVALQTADLANTNDQLELTLRGANVGLWNWNAKTGEVDYSPTFMKQLGFTDETEWTCFEDWKSSLHPDDHDSAMKRVEDYFSRITDEYKSSFRLRCRDGSYRWMLAQGRAVFDDDGAPVRMMGVHVDVTEQVYAEHELKRLNLALESANTALKESNIDLQQFAYVASHDLQTPLRAIAGFSQLLQVDYSGKLDANADGYIGRIVVGVKRMQTMINDLLAYSRVQSQASPFEEVSLDDVFVDAISLLEAQIDDTQADVTSQPLPTVNGDPAQLSQLLTNLIGNALKYHSGKPVIRVWAVRNADGWSIAVNDNGIGIAPKYHERVFEVFRRLHDQQQYPGTGIGLAVCRRIAKRHGGGIRLDSAEDRGSTFWIDIPDVIEVRDSDVRNGALGDKPDQTS